jgi:hypothetical protein
VDLSIRASLMVVAFGLGGCDPGFELKGRVTSQDGQGIQQAEVLVSCKGAVFEYAISNVDGSFSATRIGGCSNDCDVVVRAQTYQPYRAPVSHHCTKAAHGGCEQVEVNAKLKRIAD